MKKQVTAVVLTVLILFGLLPAGSNAAPTAKAAELKYGDYFILGRYLNEEIVWRHVGSNGYGDVALSFKILTSKAYNSKGVNPDEHSTSDRIDYGANIWKNSTLRAWLNSDAAAGHVSYIGAVPSTGNVTANPYENEAGFLTSFTPAELAAMKPTSHAAALNEVDSALIEAGTQVPGWDNGAGLTDPIRHKVTDTIFLPDAYLLSRIAGDSRLNWSVGYWSTGFHRAGITDSAVTQAQAQAGGAAQTPSGEYNAVDYWTGTPQGSQWGGTHQMQIRLIGGGHSFVNVNDGVMGVRPAFYINHENITVTGGSGTQDDPYTIGVLDGSLGVTLKGNNTTNIYTPDTDKLQITATAASGLDLSYIMVDPEVTLDITTETVFNSHSPTPLSHTNGKATLSVSQNCTVWVMAKGMAGGKQKTAFASFTYKNFYESLTILQEGKIQGTESFLYRNTVIPGDYGVALNKYKSPYTLIAGAVSDVVNVTDALPANLAPYWTRVNGMPADITLDNTTYYTNNPITVTMEYEKIAGKWWTVELQFVLETDNSSVSLTVDGQSVTGVTLTDFMPDTRGKFSDFNLGYELPVGDNLYPYAWEVDGSGSKIVPGTDGINSDFDPEITKDNEVVKIYYKASRVTITESFVLDGTDTKLKPDVKNWVDNGSFYRKLTAPKIDHYVVTGYQINNQDPVRLTYIGDNWDSILLWKSIVEQLSDDIEIIFFFAPDINGDNVPDTDQYRITAHWIGVMPDGTETGIKLTKYAYTRKGTVNTWANTSDTINNSAPGNTGDIISGTSPAQWIFDNTRQDAPALQMITRESPEYVSIYFYYNYDSLGIGTPDTEQGVTNKYAVYNGSSLSYPPEWADTFTNVLRGERYSRAVTARADYVAVGWLLDGETITNLRPFTGTNGNLAVIDPTTVNHTVTFVYRTAAAPVTIKWVGTAHTGSTVELGRVTVTGYVGENLAIDETKLRESVSVDAASWREAGNDVPNPIVFSSSPQTYSFNYDEVQNFNYYIYHLSTDGKTLKNVEKISKSTNDSEFDQTAETFPNYTYKRYEVREFDRVYASGTANTVTLNPALGAMSVYFYYEPAPATVTINAELSSGGPVPGFTQIVINNVPSGTKFSYDAPYITGYKLTDIANATKEIDVIAGAANTITFKYEALPTGNVHVILKEDDTNGRIIATEEHTLYKGETKIITVPNLSDMFYSPLSTAKTVTYAGEDITIEYYYEKDVVQVVKKTYLTGGETPITQTIMGDYRVGEIARFYAPSKDDHELADAALKLVRIIPPPNTRVIYYQEVRFDYMPIAPGSLVVEAVNESGSILHTYTVTGTEGETITVNAPTVPGYVLKQGEPGTKPGTIPGKVTFTYVRESGTGYADLTVAVKSSSGAAIDNAEVTAKAGGMTIRTGKTDIAGKTVLTDLPARDYDITVRLTGYHDGRASITLTGDSLLEITLTTIGGSSGTTGGGNPGKEQPAAPDYGLLEKTIHNRYIYGFPDGTIRPDTYITRAETAAVLYRLLREKPSAGKDIFSDVSDSSWYADAVYALTALDIFKGYPDGSFGAKNDITRAEFVAVISRFDTLENGSESIFSDVDATHWAAKYIHSAYAKGYIFGDPDGTFRPDSPITRAEAVTLLNRVLGRKVRREDVSISDYPDLSEQHWAYADMIEAATDHDYVRDEDGYELWYIGER